MLSLKRVEKSYAGRTVLHPTDLEIRAGRTTVLIGPSGCGKSTLLRLMIGLIEPDAGSVTFQHEEMRGKALRELRQRMGYVIQDGGLFPHLTAHRNAALMAHWLGWEKREIDRRVRELAELTHLPLEALERYPAQLSGGQRQRVSLMRALMLNPDVLLLDEPLGALDPLIRAELQSDLSQIFRTLGKTVVLVTHDLAEAAFFSDEVILMRAGSIVQQGTIGDLLHRPTSEFVTTFIQAQRQTLEVDEDAPSPGLGGGR